MTHLYYFIYRVRQVANPSVLLFQCLAYLSSSPNTSEGFLNYKTVTLTGVVLRVYHYEIYTFIFIISPTASNLDMNK